MFKQDKLNGLFSRSQAFEGGLDEEFYTDASGNLVLFANFDKPTVLFSLQGDCFQGSSNAKTDLGVTNCLQLDGSGDFAQSVDSTLDFNLASSEAGSFEMWVRPTLSLGGSTVGYMHHAGGSWGLIHYGASDASYLYANSSGVNDGSPYELNVNSWNHLAWCRNAAGNCSLFQNGTRVSTTSDSSAIGTAARQIFVGRQDSAFPALAMQGQIGPIRLIAGATPYDPTQSSLTQPTTKFEHLDY